MLKQLKLNLDVKDNQNKYVVFFDKYNDEHIIKIKDNYDYDILDNDSCYNIINNDKKTNKLIKFIKKIKMLLILTLIIIILSITISLILIFETNNFNNINKNINLMLTNNVEYYLNSTAKNNITIY